MFRAILIEKGEAGHQVGLTTLDDARLPEGEVTVRVSHSSINYKDALAITKGAPIVRSFPMVPGIDLAGTVEESRDPRWRVGDAVLVNGWGLGEAYWGGLAERARLKGDWLVSIPRPLDARRAMAIGTAGYTAMLCVKALERHGVAPGQGEVLVTGAAGGVGSVAVALLARRGYQVVASTGRVGEEPYFKALGASGVVDRALFDKPGRPLGKERWAGAIDTVGSHTLANVCGTMRYGGVVAACGLAQGMDLPASVAPFILRGVTLAGIDSVYCPRPVREEAWAALSRELDLDRLESMITEVGLDGVEEKARELLAGRVRGRIVVAVG